MSLETCKNLSSMLDKKRGKKSNVVHERAATLQHAERLQIANTICLNNATCKGLVLNKI
jgi:hypothetical protein